MNQRREIVINNFDDFKKLYDTVEQDGQFNIVFTYSVGKGEITVTCPLYVGLEAAYHWFTHHRLIAEKIVI